MLCELVKDRGWEELKYVFEAGSFFFASFLPGLISGELLSKQYSV